MTEVEPAAAAPPHPDPLPAGEREGAVVVEPVPDSKRARKAFLLAQRRFYRGDKAFVQPLLFEKLEYLDPRRSPFFGHGEAQLFLARDRATGEVLGRVSAQVDRLHNETHQEKTGFFGFFESIDDPAVARALLAGAEGWLRARGMDRVRGPFSFNINEETGLLVEGFDTPPYLLMAHNPPYYPRLVEACGYAKAKDLFAWHYHVGDVNDVVRGLADAQRAEPSVTVRTIRMADYERDLRTFLDVFNDAWRANWGFVPLTEPEIAKMAKDLKMVLEPELALIAEVDGEPAAISLAIPNVNEALRGLSGRLTCLPRLLWRVKVRGLHSARAVLLGIRKKFRGKGNLRALSVLLYHEMHERGKRVGMREGELSWTLEDNVKINSGVELMGGRKYKTYRIYEKLLAP